MKSWTRWLSVSFVVAVVSVGTLCQAAWGQERGSFERTLKVQGPVQLHFNAGAGDVVLHRGDPGVVHVKGIIHISGSLLESSPEGDKEAHDLESNPPIQQDGSLIRIGFAETRESSRQARPFPTHVSIDYEVVAPVETQINSKTGSGDFSISGIRGPVTVESSSGDVKIEAVPNWVRIRTGSGDVVLESSGAEGIQVETGSGDIVLQIPSGAGFELSAHTGSGDISVESRLSEQVTVNEHEAHGRLNGGTHPLDLRTGSGDIRID